jgi:hypothetical protein
MTATTRQGQQAWRERVEREDLARIAARLAIQFPELPADDITHAIQGRYAEFDGSRIRDFAPVPSEDREAAEHMWSSATTEPGEVPSMALRPAPASGTPHEHTRQNHKET